jgi:hypothetical protein
VRLCRGSIFGNARPVGGTPGSSAGDARQQPLRLALSTALPASWRVQARHPRVAVLITAKSDVMGLRST